MKAAFLRAPNHVSVEDVPTPKIGRGEVLVKMMASGVCQTDVKNVRAPSQKPVVLGHEVTGEVVEVGEGVSTSKVGDRVFVHHHVPCFVCYYCRSQDYTMCDDFRSVNLDPCGFAEYFRVPRQLVERGSVLQLPSEVSFESGTLIEPTGCCIRAIVKCNVRVDSSVSIIGVGPIGLTFVQLLKVFGAGQVIVSDLSNVRLEVARRFGADVAVNPSEEGFLKQLKDATEGRGPDIAVVAVGSIEAVAQALDSVRKGGKVILFGELPERAVFSYELGKILRREISIVPSYSTTEIETNMALGLMKSRRIDLGGLISHRLRLDSAAEAVQIAAEGRDSLKVILLP